ncbi:hypothetical protein [uncultured Roseovarius sp.]|uniref:hypothetical protein n=1 Tax=uncultured Roseovarius sp. TaxID=293344 RepID=UPI00259205C4|nr:hypothetical protein [uncultured Roseovarius sp.]
MAFDERFANAADLLVKIAAFAASPSPLTFGAAAAGGYLNMKSLIGRARSDDLESRIAEELREGLIRLRGELPEDADVLFFQMLELGAPNARDLVALNLSAERIATLISERAEGPDYSIPGLKSVFERWITPPLASLLGAKDFIASMAPEIARRTLESLAAIGLNVEILQMQSDELREALSETTALVRSIDQSVEALRRRVPFEDIEVRDSDVSVTHILAAQISLGTYTDVEVREIRRRLEQCNRQFIEVFEGQDRKRCICFVLNQVKDGNGGTIPDPNWQSTYDQLNCEQA